MCALTRQDHRPDGVRDQYRLDYWPDAAPHQPRIFAALWSNPRRVASRAPLWISRQVWGRVVHRFHLPDRRDQALAPALGGAQPVWLWAAQALVSQRGQFLPGGRGELRQWLQRADVRLRLLPIPAAPHRPAGPCHGRHLAGHDAWQLHQSFRLGPEIAKGPANHFERLGARIEPEPRLVIVLELGPELAFGAVLGQARQVLAVLLGLGLGPALQN